MSNALDMSVGLKGIVELTLTNCVTGEVEWTHTQENVVSIWTMVQLLGNPSIWRANTGSTQYDRIAISGEVLVPNEITQYTNNFLDSSDSSQSGDNTRTIQNESDINSFDPHYIELVQKFNAPTNTRIINSVYVSNNNGSVFVQHVNLTVPARQLGTTTTEAGRFGQDLTVRWRTEFFFNTRTSGNTGIFTHPYMGWYTANWWVERRFSYNEGKRFPHVSNTYWQTELAEDVPYLTSPYTGSATEEYVTSRSNQSSWFKYTYTFNDTITEDVGQLFGQFGYGCTDAGCTGHVAFARAVPEDFPNKIQPLHNHGPNNIVPFQDTDELARKNGIIQISEGNGGWDNPDYPYHFLLDITNSGDVATSRYIFRTRHTMGYAGNTWQGNRVRNRFHGVVDDTDTPAYVAFGNRETNGELSIELNDEYINIGEWITWQHRSAGISIFNEINGDVITFDDTTSPALGSTVGTPEVNQAVAEDDGTIWVADRVNGAHKITDPLGSPSVTTYTASTIYGGTPPGPAVTGSPHDGDEDAVFGVGIGYNGRVWAVVDGAIAWTDNGGASWTAYDSTTTPSISHGGIDGTFSDIDFMRIDRESELHEMALCKDNWDGTHPVTTDQTGQYWWWRDFNGGETIQSSVFTHYDNSANGSVTAYGHFKVSKYGGTWMHGNIIFGKQRRTNWGNTGLGTQLGGNQSTYPWFPNFVYDRNNTPYMMAFTYRSGSSNFEGLYHGTQIVGDSDTAVRNQLGGTSTASEVVMIHSQSKAVCNLNFAHYVISPLNSTGHNDKYYIEHTPFSHCVWDEWRWDSSSSPQQWRKNWNNPATDTASYGPFDGIRKGFATEDHEFQGMSHLDISEVISGSPNPLTSELTVVMTVKGKAKDTPGGSGNVRPIQTADRTLVGLGAGRRNNISLFWDFNGQVFIQELQGASNTNQNLTAVPGDWSGALGDVHRIVLVIQHQGSPSTRQYSVYLDGSQIGTTMTGVVGTDLSPFTDFIIGGTSRRREHGLAQQFAGFLEDVQIWDVAWTSGDVTADHSAWDAASKVPTLTPPAGSPQTLLARYQLTESLTNTESKATHTATEELTQNLFINFADNTDTPSFEAGDWYTFGVYDGIMKDNAIDWSSKFHLYFNPTDFKHSDFTNAAGTNIIPAAPEVHTEPLYIVNTSNLASYNGNIGSWNSTSLNWANYGGRGFQHFRSGTDGEVSWKVHSNLERAAVGLVTTSTTTYQHNNAAVSFAVRFDPGPILDFTIIGDTPGGDGVGKWLISGDHVDEFGIGSFVTVFNDPRGSITSNNNGPFEVKSVVGVGSPVVNTEITIGGGGHIITALAGTFGTLRASTRGAVDITESGAAVATVVAKYQAGDEFKFTRDGTTGQIDIYKVDASGSPTDTLIYTSGFSSTADLWPIVNFERGGMTIYDATITYTREAYTLNVGANASPATGKYHPDFYTYDNEDDHILDISIDQGGSPQYVPAAIKTISDNVSLSDTSVPAASGEVVFCDRRAGVLKFHPSDAGKAVIGNVVAVYTK